MSTRLDHGDTLLELNGVRVLRDGREILSVDRFVVRSGEHIAILGPNGAGKSTLINVLTRDVAPLWADPPPVRVLGDERIELSAARQLIGVVSSAWQEVVDVHLPVREVVIGGRLGALGIPPHLRTRVSDEDERAADRAIEEVGLGDLAARDMTSLSTGEARRALVARALANDPPVLVLDEPCAGLDPTAAWQLRASMRTLAQGGRTIILVTHHVEDVIRDIERAVLMSHGRIVEDGSKGELLTSGKLTDLFGVGLEVECRDGEYRLW